MIRAAERNGYLGPDRRRIVEATAGNTGLGLALAAAQRGYELTLVIPDKMSREKILHAKALGATVVMTRSDVEKGHPDYYVDLAKRIARETGAYLRISSKTLRTLPRMRRRQARRFGSRPAVDSTPSSAESVRGAHSQVSRVSSRRSPRPSRWYLRIRSARRWLGSSWTAAEARAGPTSSKGSGRTSFRPSAIYHGFERHFRSRTVRRSMWYSSCYGGKVSLQERARGRSLRRRCAGAVFNEPRDAS
jgi:hypothetical protein